MLDGKPFEAKFELLCWDGDVLVATWRSRGPDGEVTISKVHRDPLSTGPERDRNSRSGGNHGAHL
jgi:hypothetical protein